MSYPRYHSPYATPYYGGHSPAYTDPYENRYLQGGMGQPNLQQLQYLIAQLIGGVPDQSSEPQQAPEPFNPYLDNIYRPSPVGLSPMARFQDMSNRRAAQLRQGFEEGKQAVAYIKQMQDEIYKGSHPDVNMTVGVTPYEHKPINALDAQQRMSAPDYDVEINGDIPNAAIPHPIFINGKKVGSVNYGPKSAPGLVGAGGDMLPVYSDPNNPMQTTFAQGNLLNNTLNNKIAKANEGNQKVIDDITKKLGLKK